MVDVLYLVLACDQKLQFLTADWLPKTLYSTLAVGHVSQVAACEGWFALENITAMKVWPHNPVAAGKGSYKRGTTVCQLTCMLKSFK